MIAHNIKKVSDIIIWINDGGIITNNSIITQMIILNYSFSCVAQLFEIFSKYHRWTNSDRWTIRFFLQDGMNNNEVNLDQPTLMFKYVSIIV